MEETDLKWSLAVIMDGIKTLEKEMNMVAGLLRTVILEIESEGVASPKDQT